ncbi:MAG: response regulator transcription factor [Akkermansiaceae bacterium]|jgi:DNA-binding NarL/FixJ family response regulator|nr:response regulator transcription factor [Akkermansiaceae bacterium]MDP4648093.1 response regulator transcription factor [Akkermansiaceae bacterium]MDP4720825.1 response regulator transcription factor [Akkermansiaceae bacterium]MDP4780637.1 response regulator transcription factor [Akkermansiaceae bacterium]MDP4848481.1 response regulator transcription factor [Akkermansiaceae bacterium]
MNKTIKVMMIEDHPEYREAVQHVLAKEKDINFVGVFGNADQALRSLQQENHSDLPDVILLDLCLPGMSGFEAMSWIVEYAPLAKIMVLSQSDKESEVFAAIQKGASGYLLKSSTMDEIKSGIRTVMTGGATLDPSIAKYLLNELRAQVSREQEDQALTPREIDILKLIAEGLSQKDIARQLKLSVYTVAEHLTHIYGKLQVQNAPSAVSKAFRSGILK